MSGYIKRNDAINRLQEIADDYEYAGDKNAFYVADYCLHHIMELCPATDVVERKMGKWNMMTGHYTTGKNWYRFICSECNCVIETANEAAKPYHYCPNCGAKMEE